MPAWRHAVWALNPWGRDLPRPVEGAALAWIPVRRLDRTGQPFPANGAHLVQGYRDSGLDAARLGATLSEFALG